MEAILANIAIHPVVPWVDVEKLPARGTRYVSEVPPTVNELQLVLRPSRHTVRCWCNIAEVSHCQSSPVSVK
jgi:hypothetical protein